MLAVLVVGVVATTAALYFADRLPGVSRSGGYSTLAEGCAELQTAGEATHDSQLLAELAVARLAAISVNDDEAERTRLLQEFVQAGRSYIVAVDRQSAVFLAVIGKAHSRAGDAAADELAAFERSIERVRSQGARFVAASDALLDAFETHGLREAVFEPAETFWSEFEKLETLLDEDTPETPLLDAVLYAEPACGFLQ